MQKIKTLVLSIFALAIFVPSFSQTNSYSPYTRYGYGQLAESGFGASRAMGGASLGLRDNHQINPANPASYSAIDSTTFLFDFGVSAQIGNFQQGNLKATKYNGNIDYLAMQFPITKGLGASVGIIPYSFVGYQFGDSIKLKGQSSYIGQNSYYGDGGLSQAYFGIAGRLFKHFSLGVNLNYFFGTINHTKQSYSSDYTPIIVTKQIRTRAFRPEFGAQYFSSLGKDRDLTIGVKYVPKISLNATTKTMEYTKDTTTVNSNYELAETYGIGMGLKLNKQWRIAMDGTYQKWANAIYDGQTGILNNRLKISGGADYTPNSISRNYFDRVHYRFGGYYTNNYLNVKDSKLTEYGVSAGIGMPFKSSKSQLNLSVEYSRLQPEISTFVKENYLKFTLNLTFDELWFFKRKLE